MRAQSRYKTALERNGGVPEDRRIEFRVGIHVGTSSRRATATLSATASISPRGSRVSRSPARSVSPSMPTGSGGRLDLKVTDLGATQLKNIAEPPRLLLEVGQPALAKPAASATPPAQGKAHPPTGIGPSALPRRLPPFCFSPRRRLVSPRRRMEKRHKLRIFRWWYCLHNLSGDPSQDYFADGVTENLTTELSRVPNSFVIARTQPSLTRAKASTPRRLRKSSASATSRKVRPAPTRTASASTAAIDAETGAHLWADGR